MNPQTLKKHVEAFSLEYNTKSTYVTKYRSFGEAVA
jgi:hypothetical protein